MKRVYFIGICGTAMATVAAMLKKRGSKVWGSDRDVYPPMSQFLEREQIPVFQGFSPEHITSEIDLVVVGNAISRGNPELEEVLDRRIRYCSLPELIREEFLWGARSIVIAGTHGKTTTTSIAGWLLTEGGLDPTVLIGGIATNFASSYRLGGGREFVIEGDEYDSAYFDKTAKFLKYLPDIAVVTNIEFDHADIYEDLAEVLRAFRRFVVLVPRSGLLLLGSDNETARTLADQAKCPVETFGVADGSDWQAFDIRPSDTHTAFKVRHGGTLVADIGLPLVGSHNVTNALAAIAVGHRVGLSLPAMVKGLESFRGVQRRLDLRGEVDGVKVYDDFAHHPTAVERTLSAVRRANPNRTVWAIFEPRSASSCLRMFQDDFVNAFRVADRVILASVFRSTIPNERRLSPEAVVDALRSQGVDARYGPRTEDIVQMVARDAKAGDLVVIMSNGGFDGVHDKILSALAERARVS